MARVYNSGDVILIQYPFSGGTGSKTKTAVVLLDTEDDDVIVVPTTSKGARTDFDVEIKDLRRAGLNEVSHIRLEKPQTIDKKLVSSRRPLGRLATPDMQQLQAKLSELWGQVK